MGIKCFLFISSINKENEFRLILFYFLQVDTFLSNLDHSFFILFQKKKNRNCKLIKKSMKKKPIYFKFLFKRRKKK